MEKKYMVAPRKSISTPIGTIDEYGEISVKKLGSVSIFEALVKMGSIVEAIPRPARGLVTVNMRSEKKPARGVLPSPAKAELSRVEIIEAPIVKKANIIMPDEKKQKDVIQKKKKEPEQKQEEHVVEEIQAPEETPELFFESGN